ncbi:MAG: hypothetical protein E7317_01335 [Clostridiales bacterium]|nr:hypothetical protein [Clostridiales bacterium]
MNPLLKAAIMFVIGCIVMIASQWAISLAKETAFEINWPYTLGLGAFIAIADLIVPADKRRQNRMNRKNMFRR